ncbi:MAG TPA: hypothetical protein PLJ04_00185 [Candidatus Saccharibacteria bacterium]|nr:hypothetical protein [Candidatus Nomurabacteria bacterium]HPR09980.1 hypothetical protein [Candidatus Saccharibacteria bacterium]
MNPKKMYYLLVAALVVTLLAIGGVLYLGRGVMLAASEKVIDAKLNIIKAEKTEETYLKNKQIYLANSATAEKLNYLVPTGKEQAAAVETIYSFANNANLTITSVVFPGSSLDPTVKQKTKVDISQATPVKDLKGVYEIPIEVSISGGGKNSISTNQILNLIESIEASPRNMRITAITYDSTSGEIRLNISLFVKKPS